MITVNQLPKHHKYMIKVVRSCTTFDQLDVAKGWVARSMEWYQINYPNTWLTVAPIMSVELNKKHRKLALTADGWIG